LIPGCGGSIIQGKLPHDNSIFTVWPRLLKADKYMLEVMKSRTDPDTLELISIKVKFI
jgi:hypothetical protein